VLVEVGERLAFCRLAAIVDGTAALVVQQRRGGAFPEVSDDARVTFDHEEKLIVLRGMLTLGASSDDMQFSVTHGVLLPTRRATTPRLGRGDGDPHRRFRRRRAHPARRADRRASARGGSGRPGGLSTRQLAFPGWPAPVRPPEPSPAS
jgi:hypothetical protein